MIEFDLNIVKKIVTFNRSVWLYIFYSKGNLINQIIREFCEHSVMWKTNNNMKSVLLAYVLTSVDSWNLLYLSFQQTKFKLKRNWANGPPVNMPMKTPCCNQFYFCLNRPRHQDVSYQCPIVSKHDISIFFFYHAVRKEFCKINYF